MQNVSYRCLKTDRPSCYTSPECVQVKPGYKGHPIEFRVDLGPFGTIEDHLRTY